MICSVCDVFFGFDPERVHNSVRLWDGEMCRVVEKSHRIICGVCNFFLVLVLGRRSPEQVAFEKVGECREKAAGALGCAAGE